MTNNTPNTTSTDSPTDAPTPAISAETLSAAETVIGLHFTDSEWALALEGVNEQRGNYEKLRAVPLDNSVPPAFAFDPRVPGLSVDAPAPRQVITLNGADVPPLPANFEHDPEQIAFWPLAHLAHLLQTRQITSVALTTMYLGRLKHYDPLLHCVVTLTEALAMQQAQRADAEIAAGQYRGVLHGIPWGAKDLLATSGIRTTWGAAPYADQVLDYNATVVDRLDEAGAVLIAKLTLGELAMDDVWFGGMTRTPWDVERGSSGSSAGSGSATAAGLVGFAIGTETHGSIVSPATRCRVSGLRPTAGRVSKHGAMMLAWTMDKIGPMGRTVEDCALVFNAIYGPDGKDLTVADVPFQWMPDKSIDSLKVGYLKSTFDEENEHSAQNQHGLNILRGLGIELIPIELPDYPVNDIGFLLLAEAAASFDDLTRTDRDDLLARQAKDSWPSLFRQARLIPAVEYIQAQRVRTLIMREMVTLMQQIDVYVAPSFGGTTLLLTNLTGNPAVVVPNGVTDKGEPSSLTFTGKLYGEADTLLVARAYQNATDYHLQHPPLP